MPFWEHAGTILPSEQLQVEVIALASRIYIVASSISTPRAALLWCMHFEPSSHVARPWTRELFGS